MPLLPSGDADLQRAIFQAIEAGNLRLVGADGLDRSVTRSSEIGVGQSGLRLAEPRTEAPSEYSNETGDSSKAQEIREQGGGQDYEQGETPKPPEQEQREQEVAFSLMTSLTDEDQREAVRLLLRNLANVVDEGAASYAHLMVKITVDSSVAGEIAKNAGATGVKPTVKDN